MRGRLEDKVALITGTAGGQGRAAALRFAQEGARIVGCDRNLDGDAETVQMVRDAGGEMVSRAPVDLTDESQVKAWIAFAIDEFGDFDILYNNASGCRFALIEAMTLDQWNYTLANELTLVFLAIKHAVPVFMRRESGCILNTASIAGMGLGGPSGFAHAATKGGVIAMTACLAVELSPLNVRVNAIAPGVIDTPGLKPLTSSPAGEAQKASALVPRFGTSEDIAAAAAYLCSDEASYVTGITLPVEGGFLASGGAGRPPVRMALPIEFN